MHHAKTPISDSLRSELQRRSSPFIARVLDERFGGYFCKREHYDLETAHYITNGNKTNPCHY